jgi:ABC-type antimicrobial peptide transport system permease subunit
VLAFAVAERRQEIGIRLALGAAPRRVAAAVVRRALGYAAAGLAVGLVVALLVTRFLRTLLFGLEPTDPLTFAAACAGLLVVGLVAAWLPVRRALALDPTDILRQ